MRPNDFSNDMYDLKPGQWFGPDVNSSIRRVPGGWVYGDLHGTCFIPFSDEFMPNKAPTGPFKVTPVPHT